MTREEAIEFLYDIMTDCVYRITRDEKEACEMAINALQEPERKHGRWIYRGNAIGKHKVYECSRCHSLINGRANYCKECGAIMDEEDKC